VIIVDTGVIVAMGNRRDDDHERCTQLLMTTVEPLVLPEPLLVEVGYMLGSRAGATAEADFRRDVADGVYTLESMLRADVVWAAADQLARRGCGAGDRDRTGMTSLEDLTEYVPERAALRVVGDLRACW
jgi:hypothetical protein